MANILVTGGAGFVGSNLTEVLLRQGHTVRVLDNFSSGRRENLLFGKNHPALDVVEGDISEHLAEQVASEVLERIREMTGQEGKVIRIA